MIEMLGVLAIIGVLSAGGIMGYSAAMDAYTFNKFVNDVQQMHGAAIYTTTKLHNRLAQNNLYAEDMYKLGILPDDWYKNRTSTHLVKNPFLKDKTFVPRLTEFYATTEREYSTNLGTYIRPAGTRQTTLDYNILVVPKKVCIKIYTYNWGKDYNIQNYQNHMILSPISVSEAEALCPSDENMIYIGFILQGKAPQ